jgi:glycine cleavage system H protein
MYPKNYRYAESHEWVNVDGDTATVGITQFAVEQLTDVVYLDLAKKVGANTSVKGVFGQIESVKAVSDLYAPVAGEIVAVNDAVTKDPAAISSDPHGKGWLIKIKLADKKDVDQLMTAEQYEKQIASQGH